MVSHISGRRVGGFWCRYHNHWRVGEGQLSAMAELQVYSVADSAGSPNTASMTQDWFRFSEEKREWKYAHERQPTKREKTKHHKENSQGWHGALHSNQSIKFQLYCISQSSLCRQAHQIQFLLLVVKKLKPQRLNNVKKRGHLSVFSEMVLHFVPFLCLGQSNSLKRQTVVILQKTHQEKGRVFNNQKECYALQSSF